MLLWPIIEIFPLPESDGDGGLASAADLDINFNEVVNFLSAIMPYLQETCPQTHLRA